MPREPHGLDALELESDSGYIPRSLRDQVAIPKSLREKWHDEVRNLFRPSRNGYNDSLSHLFLIDTLMRLKPDQIIRAGKLRDLLAKERPQVVWDAVTVGRMLNELVDLAEEHAGKRAKPPLTSGRDRYGNYFLLTPGPATYEWLMGLRQVAATSFEEELLYLQKGLEPPTRSFSVFESGKFAVGAGAAAMLLIPGGDRIDYTVDVLRAVLASLGVL